MDLSKYKVHNGYLLVKSLKAEEKDKKSGIFLSKEKDEECQTSRCEVMLVPEIAGTEVGEFKPGDIVYFSKLVPDDVMMNVDGEDVELWFILESDVKMSYGE